MNLSLVEILIEVFTFAFVVVFTYAAVRGVDVFMTVRRRLGSNVAQSQAPTGSLIRDQNVKNPFLRWVQSSSSLSEEKDRTKLRRDLSMAGFDHPAAPVWYIIVRFAVAVGLPIAFLLCQPLLPSPMTGLPLILGALLLCAIGLILPRAVVDNRAGARREQLEIEFPDALDLMVVCVEAGLGLEAAFVRVGEDVQRSHPRIAEAFNRVSQEFRAGRSRADALRAMADRNDVDTLKSFVALLVQTETLGASIGQTLRTYAGEMREHRFLRAEEKAMRIPVLLTLPLVACILPVIVTALLLPPILDVSRTLVPALAGHH
ncbi:MAG TPA: type II secretion system F family protein [Caulobacteraceae bacterium]|nr:type II secretion system F family protein [Caulobacteraceae bacterium]